MTMIKDDDKAYFAHPYLSRSDIVNLNESYYVFEHGRKHNTSSRDKTVGSIMHCLVLEPENFDKKFALFPGKARHGKTFEKFAEEHKGQNIIISSELADAKWYISTMPNRIRDEIYADGCVHEISVYNDKLKMKCKPDTLNKIKHTIRDLKSIRSIKTVKSSFASYGYNIQAALYCRVLEEETGHPHTFVFDLVDKDTGAWYEADINPIDIEIANRMINRGIQMYKNKTNYTGRITVSLPKYYRTETEELMESDICF